MRITTKKHYVHKPYLGRETWLVVITENGIRRPESRNVEVIRCHDRAHAWQMFRVAAAENGQQNKTEDVTGRLPIDWYAFRDWKNALLETA